jgi:hypothetical protein
LRIFFEKYEKTKVQKVFKKAKKNLANLFFEIQAKKVFYGKKKNREGIRHELKLILELNQTFKVSYKNQKILKKILKY